MANEKESSTIRYELLTGLTSTDPFKMYFLILLYDFLYRVMIEFYLIVVIAREVLEQFDWDLNPSRFFYVFFNPRAHCFICLKMNFRFKFFCLHKLLTA